MDCISLQNQTSFMLLDKALMLNCFFEFPFHTKYDLENNSINKFLLGLWKTKYIPCINVQMNMGKNTQKRAFLERKLHATCILFSQYLWVWKKIHTRIKAAHSSLFLSLSALPRDQYKWLSLAGFLGGTYRKKKKKMTLLLLTWHLHYRLLITVSLFWQDCLEILFCRR